MTAFGKSIGRISGPVMMNHISYVRFQVLTAARINMDVFWVVAPCSLVEVYRPMIALMIKGSKHL
jgi:hypothetical protein